MIHPSVTLEYFGIFIQCAYFSQRTQSIMCLTTAQKVYYEFRNCDHNDSDFESEVDAIHLVDGLSFAIDDGRSFSIASDCSEITYGNSPSDTSPTTAFVIDNERSFSKFRNCDDNDSNFESEFDDIHLLDGSSFAIDDGRSFSIASDFSEITDGNSPSDISPTTAFAIDNERSFSITPDLNEDTSVIFFSDTATDEQEDMMIESSEAIVEDHYSSMVAFLEMTRHKPSRDPSFPIEMI
jgi:hypothetical protein